MDYVCETCGYKPRSIFSRNWNDKYNCNLVWSRGYLWHRKCFKIGFFPSDGKMIPETIMTKENNDKAKI